MILRSLLLACCLCAGSLPAQMAAPPGPLRPPLKQASTLYLKQLTAAEALLRHDQLAEANRILEAVDPAERGWEWRLLHGKLHRHIAEYRLPDGVEATCLAILNDAYISQIGYQGSNGYLNWAVGRSDGWVEVHTGFQFPDTAPLRIDLHGQVPTALDFSPKDESLLVAGRDGLLLLYNTVNNKIRHDLSSHFTKSLYHARWSPDGSKVAAVSWELTGSDPPVRGFAKVFNANDGSLIGKYPLDAHPASCIAFSLAGNVIYVGTWGEKVYALSLPDGKTIWTTDLAKDGRYAAVQSLALSSDPNVLLVGGKDGRLRRLDAQTGQVRSMADVHPDRPVWVNAVSKGHPYRMGHYTGNEEGMVHGWEADETAPKLGFRAHFAAVTGVEAYFMGMAMTAGRDGRVCVFSRESPGERSGKFLKNGPWDLATNIGGQFILLPGSDSSAKLLFAENIITGADRGMNLQIPAPKGITNKLMGPLAPYLEFPGPANAGALSADGDIAALGGHDGIVHVHRQLRTYYARPSPLRLAGIGASIYGMDMSPDNGLLAACGGSRVIAWEAETGVEQYKAAFPSHSIYNVRFAPGGQLFFAAATDGMLFECDARTGAIRDSLPCKAAVRKMAIHPEHPLIVAGGENGSFEVWNYQSRRKVCDLKGHTKMAPGVAFHPSEALVATVSYDQTLRVWDAYTGQCRLTHYLGSELHNVAFSHGGNRLIYTTTEGVVTILEIP